MYDSYAYLVELLDQARQKLVEAQSVSRELVRDKMLTCECRLLGEHVTNLGRIQYLVEQRRDVEAVLKTALGQ